jgi:hypothetical protein
MSLVASTAFSCKNFFNVIERHNVFVYPSPCTCVDFFSTVSRITFHPLVKINHQVDTRYRILNVYIVGIDVATLTSRQSCSHVLEVCFRRVLTFEILTTKAA